MRTENIVAVSEAVRNDIKKQYGRNAKVLTVSPGVDADHFNPAWVEENRKRVRKELELENKQVILFVGSEFRRKGLDHVIAALQDDMRLLVVGHGGELARYKKMAQKQGVAQKVRFVGHSTEVREYYAAADLVVLPSRSEAFGMSILEGMACGVPVLTTTNTGVAGIIEPEKNGYLVQSGKELRSFFKNFFSHNPPLEVGKNARQTAIKYNWDNIAKQYEELFFEIASRKRK
jgi:UDP-glucose:(heptosyl)LPS alpha-1,3-glucosyltransferase